MECDRVAIMVKGLVTMQGTIDSLTKDSVRYEIVVKDALPDWASANCDEVRDNTMIVQCDNPDVIQPILDKLLSHNLTVISVKPVRENLEDLFMRAVEHTDEPGAFSGVIQ